jgi:poly(A) polymerase
VAPDSETLAVIRELAPQLARLSGERIRVELLKLLVAPDPLPVARILLEDHIFDAILETRDSPDILERLLPLDAPEQGGPRPILRLAGLLAPGSAEAAALRLKLSNKERRHLTLLLSDGAPLPPGAGRGLRRRLLQDHGGENYGNLLRLSAAKGDLKSEDLEAYLAEREELSGLIFPIQGRDLRELGVKTGPEIGRLLTQLEDWWDAEDCRPDRAACLARLSRLLAGGK